MNVGGGEAADQLVRMMLSGTEVTLRLGGSALKNLLALTMALAKNKKVLSGKVNMTKMLKETRDLRQFPMTPEQFKQFSKLAKKQKILFSAIRDKDGQGKFVNVILPVTELDRANAILERIMYQEPSQEQEKPEREKKPKKGRQERQTPHKDKDRQAPEQGHFEAPEGPRQAQEQKLKVTPPKKDSRSEHGSNGTRSSSSTSKGNRGVKMTPERPSVGQRLKLYQTQLEQNRKPVPTKKKAKTNYR